MVESVEVDPRCADHVILPEIIRCWKASKQPSRQADLVCRFPRISGLANEVLGQWAHKLSRYAWQNEGYILEQKHAPSHQG